MPERWQPSNSMPFDFTDRQVLVTGGNRGIGRGVAEGFLAAGASLTILGIDDDVAMVAEQMSDDAGRHVRGIRCDIADLASTQALADHFDHLDVLINNAGLELITPIDSNDQAVDDTFRRIVEINVIGTFSVTRALLPKIPAGGRIVNTASVWGKTAVAEFSAYCASKHAVIGLTRSLAQELGNRAITVNAVCPGWVRTLASMRSLHRMAENADRPEDELLQEIIAAQALPGLMEPPDMATTYLFLASPEAANITGQAWSVDRGELLA